jgi:hypothetical protein
MPSRASFILNQDILSNSANALPSHIFCQNVQDSEGFDHGYLQEYPFTQMDENYEGPTDWAQKFTGMRDWAQDFMAKCNRAEASEDFSALEPQVGNETEDTTSEKKKKIGLADVSDDGIVAMYKSS